MGLACFLFSYFTLNFVGQQGLKINSTWSPTLNSMISCFLRKTRISFKEKKKNIKYAIDGSTCHKWWPQRPPWSVGTCPGQTDHRPPALPAPCFWLCLSKTTKASPITLSFQTQNSLKQANRSHPLHHSLNPRSLFMNPSHTPEDMSADTYQGPLGTTEWWLPLGRGKHTGW